MLTLIVLDEIRLVLQDGAAGIGDGTLIRWEKTVDHCIGLLLDGGHTRFSIKANECIYSKSACQYHGSE